MSNPEKCVVFIQKFRRERELESRIENLKNLITDYALEENWDMVKKIVKDIKQTEDIVRCL